MQVGDDLSSCTKDVKWTQLFPGDTVLPKVLAEKYNLYIGDTPGFNFNNPKSSAKLTDPDIIRAISESIRGRYVPRS